MTSRNSPCKDTIKFILALEIYKKEVKVLNGSVQVGFSKQCLTKL